MKLAKILPKLPEIILFAGLFVFSWWLMWHTFNYKNGAIYISTKVWSDFSANIPLIRSFSWGNNWPPQDPLFAGEPISYHFLFYGIVGLLEKIGLPLSWALNLPSLLGFWGLLLAVYLLAKTATQNKNIALLSLGLFLFNGSFSFIEFFQKHPLSTNSLQDIVTNLSFPSFGPYDGKIVSAFWNLNIYTNQRHLALGYALILVIGILLIRGAKKIPLKLIFGLGILLGIMALMHSVAYFIGLAYLSCFWLLMPSKRGQIFGILATGAIIGVPTILLMKPGGGQSFFSFHPGFLSAPPFAWLTFIKYWLLNFGVGIFILPFGFIKANKTTRIILLSFLPFFLIGNLFQFSRETAANHKFFNFFLISFNIVVATAIYEIWRLKAIGKLLAPILLFLGTLSGIIDFFPIKNDHLMKVSDAPISEEISWIKNNTSPKSIFLNSSFIYHPASIAGRSIFLAWPYFPWAGGRDTDTRSKILHRIYESRNKTITCQLLKENKIDYVTVEPVINDPNMPTIEWKYFIDNYQMAYKSQETKFAIFSTADNCLKN